MAGCGTNKPKLNSTVLSEKEMVMGLMVSQKSSFDLMQNCDLPPPLKVFSWPDKTVISSMNRICSEMGGRKDDSYQLDVYRGADADNEKLELLKALRLSQTRAREAERKAASLAKERDCLSKALLEESLRLLAYKQWVKLLEIQVSVLRSQCPRKERNSCRGCDRPEDGEDGGVQPLFVALAVCLGIAGVGLAFGSRYLL